MSIRVEQDGRLCRIALAAPEKRNALDPVACRRLLEELKGAAADENIGAILLEADGPVFCSGIEESRELLVIGSHISKPIVAAVRGVALGGGLALAANAHVVIAAQGTSFGLIGMREGKWDRAAYRALAMAIGERRALELALTGRVFGTNEALAWGLVHHVAPVFEFDDRAMEIALGLSKTSPTAIREAFSR